MELRTPVSKEDISRFKLGDVVYVTGEMITARDRAHLRILEFIKKGKDLPLDLNGRVIYHCGPLVKNVRGEWVVLSAGPTTSSRMNDAIRDLLRKLDCMVIIGKGGISVSEDMKGKFLYLAYTGGAGALASKCIIRVKDVYWLDLGMAEAMWVFEVRNFGPCIVAVDSEGNSLYKRVEDYVEENYRRLIAKL